MRAGAVPRWGWHAGGWGLLLAMLLLAFAVGQSPVRPTMLLQALASQLFGIGEPVPPTVHAALWHIRLPRVLAAVLIG
ncbi:iron ABC transporter permease, partial [Stenotrophomonas acidaminiphila]|nr:iron ABC transporter permease [Stenotrophomonas acidaminiphila]